MHAHQEKRKNMNTDMMSGGFFLDYYFTFLEQWQIGGSAQDRMVQP